MSVLYGDVNGPGPEMMMMCLSRSVQTGCENYTLKRKKKREEKQAPTSWNMKKKHFKLAAFVPNDEREPTHLGSRVFGGSLRWNY